MRQISFFYEQVMRMKLRDRAARIMDVAIGTNGKPKARAELVKKFLEP